MKNKISVAALSLAVFFAMGISACGDHSTETFAAIPQMRHSIKDGNRFIHNYLDHPATRGQVKETGWLINSSELAAFVKNAKYVHISLARIDSTTDATTLVISGVDEKYNHTAPPGKMPLDGVLFYVLESVNPCKPYCKDEYQDPPKGSCVSTDITLGGDAAICP